MLALKSTVQYGLSTLGHSRHFTGGYSTVCRFASGRRGVTTTERGTTCSSIVADVTETLDPVSCAVSYMGIDLCCGFKVQGLGSDTMQ